MANPEKYEKQASFADDATNNKPGRGGVDARALDRELLALGEVANQTIERLKLLQRDDGLLRDASVQVSALSRQVVSLIGGFNLRGAWTPHSHYAEGDVVDFNGSVWVCHTAHNAGTVFEEPLFRRFGFSGGDDAALAAVQASNYARQAFDARNVAETASSAITEKIGVASTKLQEVEANLSQAAENARMAKTSADVAEAASLRAQNAALQAEEIANPGIPYTGATKHIDLNGKNLNNVGELKLGDGSNSDYQQVILGNYGRSPGKGNYGAIFNGKQGGDHTRWMAIGTFGEDGNHISGLWADAAKAYLRLGSTNHELAKAADTILAHSGTFTGTVGYNRILSVNNGNDGMPDGAYKYGLGLSLASGNGKAQLYIAHTGGVYARGGYHTHPMKQWYRVDGADWTDVRGKPTNLAGYGITDAASRTDVTQAAPPGTVMYFAGRNPPAGWLKANGAAVSRTTYAPLFAAIGTTYGSGDGRTTFNLPDLRGEFVRGWDDGRGVDSGRALGVAQSSQMERHAHFLANSQPGGQGNVSGGLDSNTFISAHGLHKAVNNNTANVGITSFNGGRENQDETRPRNVALLACIKI